MTTTAIRRSDRTHPSYLYSGQNFAVGIEPNIFKKDSGVVVVQRQPVFRSGTFRDSWGEQTTWEELHIDMMVQHFELLRNRNIFAEVPVRDGHPGFLMSGMEGNGKVLGWHTGLAAEELESPLGKFHYLLADYEITDEDAKVKVLNKHYRNRSSEVGQYTTNDEAMFWPVYMGFAFVDIPAVEGLNGFRQGSDGKKFHIFMADKEATAVADNPGPATPPAAPPAPPTPPAAPASQPHAFQINGQATTDYGAVQLHITALETFRRETQSAARVAFVDKLAADKKILANKETLDATRAFAQDLSPTQFDAWKATWDAAPALPVLGTFGGTLPTEQTGNGSAPQGGDLQDQLSVATETVKNHRRANMPEEQVKNTKSYKSMVALRKQLGLPELTD